MPQGKTKIKAKLPSGVKGKAISKKKDHQKKNRPALPKKASRSLREAVTRTINDNIETDAKERATADGKTFRVLAVETPKETKNSNTAQTQSTSTSKAKK